MDYKSVFYQVYNQNIPTSNEQISFWKTWKKFPTCKDSKVKYYDFQNYILHRQRIKNCDETKFHLFGWWYMLHLGATKVRANMGVFHIQRP